MPFQKWWLPAIQYLMEKFKKINIVIISLRLVLKQTFILEY